MRKPVIVRSSSPHEYADFEGIFDSVPDVHNEQDLRRAVGYVERSATSEKAKEYARQNGFTIDEKIHAMVQEQSPSKYTGAMMRHPNNPDLIFITYFSGRGKFQQHYFSFLYDESTGTDRVSLVFGGNRIEKEDAEYLVEQYKKIEALTEIADAKVLFVEFGYEPFSLYQARPFKRIETADFKVPRGDYDETISSNLVFGITPEEGIVLPVLRSFGLPEALTLRADITGLGRGRGIQFNGVDEMLKGNLFLAFYGENPERYLPQMLKEWNHEMDNYMNGEKYCLMMSSAHREEYDVDLSVPNLGAMVVGQTGTFMVHDMMRLIKKADITIGTGPSLMGERLFSTIESLEGRVRIISNGREGVVFRE